MYLRSRKELVSQNKTVILSMNCSDSQEQFWSLKLCLDYGMHSML